MIRRHLRKPILSGDQVKIASNGEAWNCRDILREPQVPGMTGTRFAPIDVKSMVTCAQA